MTRRDHSHHEEETIAMKTARKTRTPPRPIARKTKAKATSVDVHVGERLRLRRKLLGMSQGKLGEAVGLTFQQVQKYERGTNRIGASRLFDLARVLDVPISFFFDGLEQTGGRPPESMESMGDRRDTLTLVRHFMGVSEPKMRRAIIDLTRAAAQRESEGQDEAA